MLYKNRMNLKYEAELINQLKLLKKNYNLVGIKSETEAEGSSYIDIARFAKFNKQTKY